MAMRWYVVHAFSGFEKKVQREIMERANREGLAEKFGEILVPTEEIVEIRNGQKTSSQRMFYPGYVLVQMDMDEEAWHLVKNTPRVTGFVGGSVGRPHPLTEAEADAILERIKEGVEKPRPKFSFDAGEHVRVIDGPFKDFNGVVEEVNFEKNKLRVSVTIFGRSTPVELDFAQVEKV
ncbi:transcription termination/antitermination protein NusG [Acidithiobacillus sulfuriphilus]|uniref:Transcription termination/antitermination protein NusG n=2 Tax=Acidithiobacillus sulfuriphilus TaxID=1867749 RepID=A0A3M8RID8_9PROT|nr:transcription termination/antitermination protein NusG [Acidithiobacillus sulfuriphilus]MCL5980724.1 transcription termination/antitermination protein NusG [Gammaproteobacteria bacterium]RNF68379.1 transcription termination/antitermination protein NusG [Acidithiobacillus sulfuriphilus]